MSAFTITVLGCSGSYSSAASACSGYLVRSPGATVLLDAGPGTSVELQRHVALDQLDAIVVSHEHPDHWTELPALYHAFRFGLERSGVPVYSTAGTRKLLDAVAPEAAVATYDWTTIDADSHVTIGDQTWTFSRTDHPVETLASRIEVDGTSIAYSSDTGPDWSPSSFEAPIDLMVYEATLPVEMEDDDIPHVSGREAGERAESAGVRSLVLTHVAPGHDPRERRDAASEVFAGDIALAMPGRTYRP